jgi:hypothetical protein
MDGAGLLNHLRLSVRDPDASAALHEPVLRSAGPGVVDRLPVGLVVRSEGEELEPVGARLEGARDLRRDADRVERADVGEVVAELDAPAPGQDDVDLLGVDVAMGERAAHPRLEPEVRDAGLLRAERRAGDARLPVVAEAVARRGVLDFAISADLVEPDRINVFERWASAEALQRFRGSGPDEGQRAELRAADVQEYVVGER